MRSNVEPLHREDGAYRNWIYHARGRGFYFWYYWTRDKQLMNGSDDKWKRRIKRHSLRSRL